jgi:hypothetical protein
VAGSVTRRFRVSQVRTDAPDDFSLAAYRPRPVAAGPPNWSACWRRRPPGAARCAAGAAGGSGAAFCRAATVQAFLLMLEDNLSTGRWWTGCRANSGWR